MPGTADNRESPSRDRPPVPAVFERDSHPVEFGRLLALSDGVFAIALTLLVLDLSVPAVLTDRSLGRELLDQGSHFIAFSICLLLVGSAWWAHHRLFSMLRGADGVVMALNIVYLGLVVLIPFAQSLLASHVNEPLVYVIFASIFAGTNAVDTSIFAYARSGGLLRERLSERTFRVELAFGASYVVVFLLSMPAAYLLGAYTMIIWLLLLPFGFAMNALQSGEGPGWLTRFGQKP